MSNRAALRLVQQSPGLSWSPWTPPPTLSLRRNRRASRLLLHLLLRWLPSRRKLRLRGATSYVVEQRNDRNERNYTDDD